MGILVDQLRAKLLPGMSIPKPIQMLYDWIEARGTYIDRPRIGEPDTGARVGLLFPDDELKAGWTDTERPGGTYVEFAARGNKGLEHWFGFDRAEVLDRLCVFAETGADGSMAAFWLTDQRTQKIVHLGSGSGSTLVCVLASDPVDFLRLLAIGYDEICWYQEFSNPPNHRRDFYVNPFSDPPNQCGDFYVYPNTEFQEWVATTFGVTIPETASTIVKHPNIMRDANPEDEFARWVKSQTAAELTRRQNQTLDRSGRSGRNEPER